MSEKDRNMAETLALRVRERGGRAFYVGGCVRDLLTGSPCKDIDLEIHGMEPDALREVLSSLGTPLEFGSSFGVFALSGFGLDIALPRKERPTGNGHRDFDISVDPHIGYEAAARRRDFTVNALMRDVITGEILDFFGGMKDLEDGVIRHVAADTFVEDPLRVLRAAQFAARFGFTVHPDTVELCRGMDLSSLPRERIEEEMKKALLKAGRPSVFFETLREMDQLDVWFPELKQLIGLEQDPKYHPEGDVWVHTMEVLDRAAAFRADVSDPYLFLMLALTHDLGKILTTERDGDRVHAYGHEVTGLPLVQDFVSRISGRSDLMSYLKNMVPLHMKPNIIAQSGASVKSTNRMFDSAAQPEDLVWFSMADRPVMSGDIPWTGDSGFLFERLETYREYMSRPYVAGKDLIDAGLAPDRSFSEILAYAHKLRLAGIPKENALKQTLSYAAKLQKKQ